MFGEQLGRFYRGKYGLDFRGIRYPYIVGAEYARPQSMFGYARMAVMECFKGNPFTILVKPDFRLPVMYIKDAARAMVLLGESPPENIRTVNYVMNGITPSPSAQEFADMVRAKIPGARIDFKPEIDPKEILGDIFKPTYDRNAQNEWNWKAEYDLEKMVEDLIQNLD